MAYVTRPALIPRDFGFPEPDEEKTVQVVEKVSRKRKPKKNQPKKPGTKKPKKSGTKKPKKSLTKKGSRKGARKGRTLPWKV